MWTFQKNFRDEVLLINRLSNGMKGEQGEEELPVKVLSLLRHHEDIIGPVLSEWWCCMMKIKVHKTWTRGELPPIDKKERAKPRNVHGLASTQSHLQT